MPGTCRLLAALLVTVCMCLAGGARAQDSDALRERVLHDWYRMILELVRHTPTYTPPVASRAFAYTAIIAYESTAAAGPDRLTTLAGQVNGLSAVPPRDPAARYDEAAVLHAALARAVDVYFSNTGPTGQRAKQALHRILREDIAAATDPETLARSEAWGLALAEHVIAASAGDGGAVVANMGFPMDYALGGEPQDWVPTNLIRLQQYPLLPAWGENRPLSLPDNDACPLPPPPAYSEEPGSPFHAEAMEVYETSKSLTDEQKLIARFWSDDPMLSPTPPGHWIAIIFQIAQDEDLPMDRQVDALVRLGIAVSDGFIVNWRDKYRYDLLRPLTYIRRVIDPKWEPLLNTPPFPEYPSGHSTQSGAAATVLAAALGDPLAFTDTTHVADGLPARSFPDFRTAANEAGISRLYGGIHFRAAIEQGLSQGDCVGAFVNRLKTLK